MAIEVKDIYDWAVSKSKITDPKDREMISKLETIIKDVPVVEIKEDVKKGRGRRPLYTLDQYKEAGLGVKPMTEVARKLKVSLPTVYGVARANGISGPGRTGLVAPNVNSKNLEYYKDKWLAISVLQENASVRSGLGLTSHLLIGQSSQ